MPNQVLSLTFVPTEALLIELLKVVNALIVLEQKKLDVAPEEMKDLLRLSVIATTAVMKLMGFKVEGEK